jgi:hypothetical protein
MVAAAGVANDQFGGQEDLCFNYLTADQFE